MLLILASRAIAANDRFTLVIDAGHGGHDAGALGAISKEKNINLAVALRFGKYVESNLPDVKVVYTRKTDVFIPLKERANIANRANADLFISVHTNALPAGKIARGFETYTLGMHRAKDNLDVAMRENSVISMEKDYQQTYQGFDPNSSESYIIFEFIQGKNMERSVELARMIQNKVCANANRPDKGVHQAGFLVLRETSMPSCLIELGFITTPDEEQLLNNDSRIDEIAKGIYQAFAKYRNKYDTKSTSVPYRSTKEDTDDMPSVVPVAYKKTKAEPAEQSTPSNKKKTSKKEVVKADSVKKEVVPTKKETAVVKKETSTPQKDIASSKKETTPAKKESNSIKNETSSVKKESTSVKKNNVKNVAEPIFKLQILASDRILKDGDAHFKGEKGSEYYKENGMFKYTLGASADYNEINRLRKSLAEKFPQAFIIAFKNGQKYNVQQAIQEFKQNKNK